MGIGKGKYISGIILRWGDIKQIAHSIGVSRQTIYNILRGKYKNEQILQSCRAQMLQNITHFKSRGSLPKAVAATHLKHKSFKEMLKSVYKNRELVELLEKMPGNGIYPPNNAGDISYEVLELLEKHL